MLKTKNLIPEMYYNQSRDFQLIGRAFDVAMNYTKMNADLMRGLPLSNNSDYHMILLTASSLGFETKHQYIAKDLQNICSVFRDLVKDKGTKSAIERAVRTLMNAQNIDGTPSVEIDNINYVIKVYVPAGLQDLILLEDLFDYILPAGYDFRFIMSKGKNTLQETTGVNSSVTTYKVSDGLIGRIVRPSVNDKRPDDSTNDIDNVGVATTYTSKVVDGTQIEEFDEGD